MSAAVELLSAPDTGIACEIHASPNFGERRRGLVPSMLVLHYTGMPSASRAIDWLSRPESGVSCHYVIDEAGRVTQLVAERHRAWHAGVAVWAGESDVNSASIGIEIQNPGHADGYHVFPRAQMRAVRDLAADIVARHAIPPERVLAHSDVAPLRKIDPGEKFDWRWLAHAGIGHWVPAVPIRADDPGCDDPATIAQMSSMLDAYGYGVGVDGACGPELATVVRAFQRHFRPLRVDGRIDRSTLLTMERLLLALSKGAVKH